MVTLTDLARQKFLEFVKAEGGEGRGLRILVSDGGSMKPEFALNFVGPDDSDDNDVVVDVGDLKVYIDPESAKWLKDASVDYVDALDDSGFKVDARRQAVGVRVEAGRAGRVGLGREPGDRPALADPQPAVHGKGAVGVSVARQAAGRLPVDHDGAEV